MRYVLAPFRYAFREFRIWAGEVLVLGGFCIRGKGLRICERNVGNSGDLYSIGGRHKKTPAKNVWIPRFRRPLPRVCKTNGLLGYSWWLWAVVLLGPSGPAVLSGFPAF